MKLSQLLISIFLSIVFIYFFSSNKKFEELAFGQQTSAYYAKDINQKQIHFSSISNYINKLTNSYNKNILFLGNSQSHSINQIKDYESNYIELLNKKLKSDISGLSYPNANIIEFYLSLKILTNYFKYNTVVIPLFFDDFRELDIKLGIKNKFIEDSLSLDFKSELSNYISLKIKKNIDKEFNNPQKKNLSFQEISELEITNFLDDFTFWQRREQIRGEFFLFLYKLRNTLFNIKANTERPLISKNFELNILALERVIKLCENKKINLILYIPPIRKDVKIPYNIKEYEYFKKKIEEISNKYNFIKHIDLDFIVEGKNWGVKDATNLIDKYELDFMHFNYEGHKQLAASLEALLIN